MNRMPSPCLLLALVAPAAGALAQPGILAGPFTYGGHEYYLLESSKWTEAEAAAVALGGHLATINDDAENDWVWSEVAKFDGQERWSWIGFNDVKVEGTWEWVSGQPVEYVNWNPGEPGDDPPGEDYGHMWQVGTWNDISDDGHGIYTLYGLVEVEKTCYPDFTDDGSLDLFDFLAYVNAFNAGLDSAECDGDIGLTLFDFLCYVNAFNAGC
jgi:hypothetical protein